MVYGLTQPDAWEVLVYNKRGIVLLDAGQKPATSIFNSSWKMTWEGELLLEQNTFKCLEHIANAFI